MILMQFYLGHTFVGVLARHCFAAFFTLLKFTIANPPHTIQEIKKKEALRSLGEQLLISSVQLILSGGEQVLLGNNCFFIKGKAAALLKRVENASHT